MGMTNFSKCESGRGAAGSNLQLNLFNNFVKLGWSWFTELFEVQTCLKALDKIKQFQMFKVVNPTKF